VGSPTVWIRSSGDAVTSIPLDQARLRDFAGSVPWRRWRSHHGQAHLSGSYWAATTGGHVVYESRLELARLLVADFDPLTAAIWAQPCRLAAVVDGKQRHHVPDFLFTTASGEATVVNVKPAHRLTDATVAQALAWPRALFTGHGWRYEVWSGCDCWRTSGSWPATAVAASSLGRRWTMRGSRYATASRWAWRNAAWPDRRPDGRCVRRCWLCCGATVWPPTCPAHCHTRPCSGD
jgi:hypothetical protein